MFKPARTIAPSVKPLSLAEAKAHLRVDHSDDDTMIDALIDAAVSHLDGFSGVLGRALVTQTWQQVLGGFEDEIRLRVGNVLGITSVTYYDASNVQQTLASSVYTPFTDELGAWLDLKAGQSWPATYDRPDAVTVTWTAGYGPAATDMPAAIRQAMLLIIGHWYANREAVTTDTQTPLPLAVDALLAPFRQTGL